MSRSCFPRRPERITGLRASGLRFAITACAGCFAIVASAATAGSTTEARFAAPDCEAYVAYDRDMTLPGYLVASKDGTTACVPFTTVGPRPPAGYDREHPFITDLKRKDFVTMRELTEAEVCAADFLDRFVDSCRTAAPLVRFLSKSLGLAW